VFDMTCFRLTYWLGLACVVVVAGCRTDAAIRVYRVAKDDPAPPAVAPGNPRDPHAGMAMPGPNGGGDAAPQTPARPSAAQARPPVGKVPEDWRPGGGSAMRRASYRVAGEGAATADVSLIILGGAAGGTLGNVNRWRGQLGQEPLDAAGLEKAVQRLATKCGEAAVVDIEGIAPGADPAADGRTVAAIVEREGETWFFKMRGNAKVVANEKQRFLEWVASVEPDEVKSK